MVKDFAQKIVGSNVAYGVFLAALIVGFWCFWYYLDNRADAEYDAAIVECLSAGGIALEGSRVCVISGAVVRIPRG